MARRVRAWPRYGLLLASVTAAVAIQGAVAPGPVQEVVVNALLGAALILAFDVARVSRGLVVFAWAVAAAGVGAAILRAVDAGLGEGEARVLSAVLVALGPPAVAVGVMRSLRASGEVRLEAVTGVLALYMLLGMLF